MKQKTIHFVTIHKFNYQVFLGGSLNLINNKKERK